MATPRPESTGEQNLIAKVRLLGFLVTADRRGRPGYGTTPDGHLAVPCIGDWRRRRFRLRSNRRTPATLPRARRPWRGPPRLYRTASSSSPLPSRGLTRERHEQAAATAARNCRACRHPVHPPWGPSGEAKKDLAFCRGRATEFPTLSHGPPIITEARSLRKSEGAKLPIVAHGPTSAGDQTSAAGVRSRQIRR